MSCTAVIPLYNKAGQVERAIESVLAQSVEDFELIVVDDGSTDGGGDVVRAVQDPRLRLITQPNAGVSAARNRGAREAVYDAVAFLDADDTWDPCFLETVSSLRSRFPDAAVWATAYRFLRRNGVEEEPKYHGALPDSEDGGLIDYFASSQGNSPLIASAVLIRKDALFQAGGFPVGVVYGEDHDTWIRLALRFPIAWSPRPRVVVHEDAANRTDAFQYTGNFLFLDSVRDYANGEGAGRPLPAGLWEYLAHRHTSLLSAKWLNGEKKVLREIVREFRETPGYALKCWTWYALSLIPYPLVKLLWRIRRILGEREERWPPFREIQDQGTLKGRR